METYDNNRRVLVGMSGGVDSAVSAYLLKENGYAPIGVNCRFFNNEDAFVSDKTCCSLDDANDARAVANRLGLPFYVFNFTDAFRENVIEPFVQSYVSGETPNPCIECNRKLKFEKLLQRALELGCDYVATGHYARVSFDEGSGRWLLQKGVDPAKDQSYVLYCLTQQQLSNTLLPLGGLTKSEVRALAQTLDLPNAKKHESQDICFVPDGDYASFIEQHLGKTFPSGDFVRKDGAVLGTHRGIIRYTIGQRRGLGLALPAPLYVCEKDLANNRVVLCSNEELYSKTLTARDVNLIAVPQIDRPLRVQAKVRYSQAAQPATVEQLDESHIRVVFDEGQRAITKGQAVVLYDGDTVVGGGTIDMV